MVLNDVFEFEGTINELQQALTETTRQRIQAEKRLNDMKNHEWVSFQISYVKLCKEWEDKLMEELIKRIPKTQQRLS